jgi:UDP-glucose 4-epimerase
VILVTGGAGYIGSHTCVELLQAGHEVIVLDNLCNSREEALRRVEQIAGRRLTFHRADVRDREALRRVFGAQPARAIDAVIHFAGLKAVAESAAQPLRYYDNNVAGTIALLEVMAEFGVQRLVFSSSATVYGDPQSVPIAEDAPTNPVNPYGRSKWMVENLLRDVSLSAPDWRIALLRYFNPVGAHASGLIGEDPEGIPNNLMPYLAQVAVGRLPPLQVFGDDYPTPDGTGVRDYIHVVDLALGHLAALQWLAANRGVATVNLGTGRGYSVLDVVRAYEQASGRQIPFRVVARRPGDVAACWANPALAEKILGWRAQHDIESMCRDSWQWQQRNPHGYVGSEG